MGFAVLRHVGSSWIRDWTYVPCSGRQILYHWATREAPIRAFECVSITNFLWIFLRSIWVNLISESQGQHLVQKTQRKTIKDLCQQGPEMSGNFTNSESWSKYEFNGNQISKCTASYLSLHSFFFSNIYLFYLAALGLICGMWDLVPWPGIEPRPPSLGAQILSHWTTKEVPVTPFLIVVACLCAKSLQSCLTPWTAAHQVPLSVRLSRQEYWSGLPFPPPGDLPDPGTELESLMSSALADRVFTTSVTWEV